MLKFHMQSLKIIHLASSCRILHWITWISHKSFGGHVGFILHFPFPVDIVVIQVIIVIPSVTCATPTCGTPITPATQGVAVVTVGCVNHPLLKMGVVHPPGCGCGGVRCVHVTVIAGCTVKITVTSWILRAEKKICIFLVCLLVWVVITITLRIANSSKFNVIIWQTGSDGKKIYYTMLFKCTKNVFIIAININCWWIYDIESPTS